MLFGNILYFRPFLSSIGLSDRSDDEDRRYFCTFFSSVSVNFPNSRACGGKSHLTDGCGDTVPSVRRWDEVLKRLNIELISIPAVYSYRLD